MREILFRAKHIHPLKENRHLDERWIEGYLSDEKHINSPKLGGEFLIDPKTVCQYIGLTDRTGRKIFEGDIFPYHFNGEIVGVVRFGEYRNPFNDDSHGGHVGFYVDWGKRKDRFRADLKYWIKVSEVNGNIFDNTELLEADHAEGD